VTFLRVKQAQFALADGRLDEAHDLLSRDLVRSHRHGQRLATKLVKAYVKRGGGHLKAGRLHEALADCQKAGCVGGDAKEVAELRRRVVEQLENKRRESDRHDMALAGAQRHAREGFVSAGVAILKEVGGDSTRIEQAQQDMSLQRAKADTALDRAESALDGADYAAAGHHLAEAHRVRPFDKRADALINRLSHEASAKARDAIVRGRMDTAAALLRAVGPVAGERLEVGELKEVVRQVAQASSALDRADARSVGRALRRVKAFMPDAKWVDEALGRAEQIISSHDALEAGPLGLMSDGYASHAQASQAARAHTSIDTRATTPIAYHHGDIQANRGSHDVLPKHFLIQVDGAGSAYTTLSSTLTIGPVSSRQRPQIGLIADPGVPVVTIERVQEDYFLRGSGRVKVNGKPGNDRLLSDGDKIELSPRCRFKFRLPHAASTTAVLELTGTRMVRGDVKRIVLLDKQMMLGSGPACHLRAEGVDEPIILHTRGGRLVCQSPQPVLVGGEAYDPAAGVAMDTPVHVGAVVFRVTQA